MVEHLIVGASSHLQRFVPLMPVGDRVLGRHIGEAERGVSIGTEVKSYEQVLIFEERVVDDK